MPGGKMSITKIYAIEDNERYFIWADEGEITVEPHNGCFRCKRAGVDIYVYPAPSPKATIVVDNGVKQKFAFIDGVLTPC